MFFVLASSLCINNFLMGLLAFIMGVAKFSPNHPFGLGGCVIIVGGIGAVTTCTLFIQALISYERRRAILATTFIKVNTRIYIFLALSFILPFMFWSIFETAFGASEILNVRLDRNTNETILICNPADVPFIGGNEVIFTLQGFVIPTIFIVYNYL